MTVAALVASVGLVVAGVWFIFWPAALIVAGVCVVPVWALLRPVRGGDETARRPPR